MKKSLVCAIALSIGAAMPSFAADGALGGVASFFGSTTATVIDVPQGVVIDTLWRVPKNTQHALAEKFGDEKGLGQNLAGFVIGVPVGMVWGVPTGFLRGAKHGLGTGWEKPFSGESFIVGMGDDK
ncbi:MAG: hypothetical protein K2W82_05480 [Candidatus Obscuribacterales bacterium]|nr:hypothetical protein [Candidatus Obscuribacterales bacterium]